MATWDECVRKTGAHGGGLIPQGLKLWLVQTHDGRSLLRFTIGADLTKLASLKDRDRVFLRFNWTDRIALIERTNDPKGFTLGRHGRSKKSVDEARDHSLTASVNMKYFTDTAREFLLGWLQDNIVQPSFHMASDGIRFSLAPADAQVVERMERGA